MNQLTQEWIDKAEDDWNVTLIVYRARKHPSYDAACFHSQQCVEKYLKARLQEANIAFGKTHNLIRLHNLVLPAEPVWNVMLADLIVLNSYSVDLRYPGKAATRADAKDAIRRCRLVRKLVRQSFNLPI
ncbi:MAG: HEPN domain-containing protein [Blastocatellales bacterium]